MATIINEKLLEEKLEQLEKARTWSPRTISKLETLIRSEDDFTVFRVNPIQFAADKNIPEAESIDLFLHANKVGLFQINWEMLCPGCSEIVHSLKSLHEMSSNYHCPFCIMDMEASMDDYIEVSFTVSVPIRAISFHKPESLSVEDFHYKYIFSHNGNVAPGLKFVDAVKPMVKVMTFVAPGQTMEAEVEVPAGILGGADYLTNATIYVEVTGDPDPGLQRLRISLVDDEIKLDRESVRPGKITLEFQNLSKHRSAVFLIHKPVGFVGTGVTYSPFLTAKKLFSTQTFRDLFRSEVIRGSESIKVKDLTFLFTDLKGSTALYERIGDLKAFALVKEHFESLSKIIQGHSGAIVKTIGDAVMASFPNPLDAVASALLILEEIDLFNQSKGTEDIILKIGVHRGPCIAVTLNDILDYFGQTINIAARVQGLANAEEIYITEDVYNNPTVKAFLQNHSVLSEKAQLKGIQGEMQVYKIASATRQVAMS